MTQLAKKTGNDAPTLISPPGYEVVTESGVATEAIGRGDACVQGASGWSKAPTGSKLIHGIALMDYVSGQTNCQFLVDGEMAGYTLAGGAALTPGADIYPSASVAGQLATDVVIWYTVATTPVANVPVQPQIRVTGADRIRVRC